MTAIVAGRFQRQVFIVADAMIQMSLKVHNYKECRLGDKIQDIVSTRQFITLLGDEIISNGLYFTELWFRINNLSLDLFNRECINTMLQTIDRYRRYTIEVRQEVLIPVKSSTIYICDNTRLRRHTIVLKDEKYQIENQYDFRENEVIIDYKGNISNVQLPTEIDDLVAFGISKLEDEHKYRKNQGRYHEKLPLGYDFQDRFSSVLFQSDGSVVKRHPFKELTDLFLNYGPDWDYVNQPDFKFSPKNEK